VSLSTKREDVELTGALLTDSCWPPGHVMLVSLESFFQGMHCKISSFALFPFSSTWAVVSVIFIAILVFWQGNSKVFACLSGRVID